jgi:hypothetical protein
MADQVHVYPKLERQRLALKRRSNAPAIAAERARLIIDRLIQGKSPANAGLMRPRTDKRLKNSLKFNLGSGFRLICIREKRIIHVMFAGDHNSTDAWLDHHLSGKPQDTTLPMGVFNVDRPYAARTVRNQTKASSQNPDHFPDEISQEDLRRVFRGLCTGVP